MSVYLLKRRPFGVPLELTREEVILNAHLSIGTWVVVPSREYDEMMSRWTRAVTEDMRRRDEAESQP